MAIAARTLACCALLAGCAAGTGPPDDTPGVVRASGVSDQAARDSIAIGKSTRADVSAALGKATVIPFDSGFEVWVYRWKGAEGTARDTTELVLLFEPSGVVRKARIRPGYGPEPK